MRIDQRVVVVILAVGVVVASTAAVVLLLLGSPPPRLPVVINGDAELDALHGVVGGDGTSGNPFVISGGRFDSSTRSGISIQNTRASLLIRDVEVRATTRSYPYDPIDGIAIFRAANVRLENVTSSNNFVGISVTLSRNVTVVDSHFLNDTYGVAFQTCLDADAVGNTFVGSDRGVWAYGSDQVTMANNTGAVAALAEIAATASSNVTVVGNMFSFETSRVIVLESSRDLLVAENVILSSATGVHVEGGSRFNVSRNRIESGGLGIEVWSSSNFTVGGNVLRANAEGLHVQDSSGGLVVGNLFENNDYAGFRAYNVTGFLVYRNTFRSNNLGAVVQVSGNNTWDDGYPTGGNYWSNYTGVDVCSGALQNVCPSPDGIGDTPYPLTPSNVDRYPLMRPPEIPAGP